MPEYYVISAQTLEAVFDYLMDRPHREWVTQGPLMSIVNKIQAEIAPQNEKAEKK